MVKHIILWTLKDEYTQAQKAEIRAGIKEGLEGLKGQIPGMIDIWDILSAFILFILAVAFIIGDYARKKGYVR